MMRALAVLLIPIALLLTFYRVVLNGDAPTPVDPGPAIDAARAAHAFPVSAPADLGADWRVASATFRREATGATLRIGYVDPDGNGMQLIESSVPPATLLPAELTAAAKPVDTFRASERGCGGATTPAAANRPWLQRAGSDADRGRYPRSPADLQTLAAALP